ncbi:Rdx family protein [bacterium]|nr:Rdx family protein [bacterium]
MSTASSLAAEIKENFQIESEIVKLAGGVFEVYVDDELVFSKKALDRFPNDGEVVGLLQAKLN